ncbi:PolC-type DNA polymerase III [Serpentinicella sp. ANB-PHB4]|uniref:PolC-type DNA polymerase III n=1 Tax=Serpentinicella sp. ANB-PHB4 TaxID=3074076 RepID=UPI00285CF467|nr:PolC-type DNA polymerase III [Serpentinicella sp. ANB-PHB4]MDR5658225.1 PolC-type DNA polymerase III [Serpentinicella sp. ANB-PHB4]
MQLLSFSDFVLRLGLNFDVPKEGCQINNIKFYRQKKQLDIFISSNNILSEETLLNIRNSLKSLMMLKDVNINIQYNLKYGDLFELIELNWGNIIFIFNKLLPSTKQMHDKMNWTLDENKLIIELEEVILIKAIERNVNKKIEAYFSNRFNFLIKCEIKSYKDGFSVTKYQEDKIKESSVYLEQVMKEQILNKENKKTHSSEQKKNNIILGKTFNGEVTNIEDIYNESGQVIIEGDIFDFECKTLNNGNNIYILSVTDYTNSIVVKIFERKNKDLDLNILKNELKIRIKGNIVFDKFLKENVLIASDIINVPNVTHKTDKSPNKRVELHLHTNMSAMDGMSTTKQLIKKAAEWGHKSIAITDHGVVQAYPEAMDAGKKNNIKIIYGIEGYFVNDQISTQQFNDQRSFDDEFVVFDIETTGLSNKYHSITEIGAIKVKNGEIIDKFSSFVNPQMVIPDEIIKLTGITNEMVQDSPTIEEILPQFIKFCGNSCLVAHNSDFDLGFIQESCKKLNYTIKNSVLDTLKLSRVLLTDLKRHKLNTIARYFKISLENHHRAIDDALATAQIFIKFIEIMKRKGIFYLKDVEELLKNNVDFRKLDTFHIIILAKNKTGLKNLYKIVSESHLTYFYKKPRIPKSLLNKYRDGLIVGSACEAGELYQALLKNKSEEEIENIVKLYDYLEIQPLKNNQFLLDKGLLRSEEDLKNINRDILQIGEKNNLPVVATGDVHFLDSKDEVYRRILMTGQGFDDSGHQPPLYLKTTDEMLKEFEYLGSDKAYEVVVDNPNIIDKQIDNLIPIPEGTFPPIIQGSEEDLRNLCFDNAYKLYGDPLPDIVKNRLDRELNSIISNGYAVMYIIAHKLVAKSLEDGYLVGSRGSVGSSFAATMSDITEVNPLPPHYVCNNCKYSYFYTDGSVGSGADLLDKACPNCDSNLIKDGHDIPFEVFLGFEGDKEPDIDLNFAGEYQSEAHKYTEELFGEGKVFRAGTIGTIADKTAYGFVRKYMEEKSKVCSNAEISRLTQGCTGVKRTSGQHPGGVMIVPADKDIYDFCPIQYPANDINSDVITTHFDYQAISGRLLKLDILGHDVPTIIRMLEDITGTDATKISLDDPETMSLFTSVESLNINSSEFKYEVGTMGIPEFGTKFVRQMLIDTKPTTFAELVRISGLSHGTDVWLNNAQDLVRSNTAQLKDVISTRDDIMNYLILKGLPAKKSFKIMENVRKGKGLSEEDEAIMKSNNVPNWYIDSCKKIKYMFPKAHAVAYVMMSFRIAYYKVHYPEAFYATYFTTRADDFDINLVLKGKEEICRTIKEIESLGNNVTAKEKNLLTVLEVVLEMLYRGMELLPIDLYKSDSDKFIVKQSTLLPPLKALQGVGQNAARNIVVAREKGAFLSKENLRERAKLTKTVIEKLSIHGCLGDLPETNQLSLF